MTTAELLTRCDEEWTRLKSIPRHLRNAEWHMQARNLDYATAYAMEQAVEEMLAEAVTCPSIPSVPPVRHEGMC